MPTISTKEYGQVTFTGMGNQGKLLLGVEIQKEIISLC